jgi:hypothetical protein
VTVIGCSSSVRRSPALGLNVPGSVETEVVHVSRPFSTAFNVAAWLQWSNSGFGSLTDVIWASLETAAIAQGPPHDGSSVCPIKRTAVPLAVVTPRVKRSWTDNEGRSYGTNTSGS